MKFIALYMAPTASIDEMMKNSTPEQMKEGMAQWMQWAQAHKDKLVDMGAPLSKNKRVTKGGVADVRNEVCGYSLVEASSHDEAAKVFAESPHFDIPGAYVEVLQCMPMPGIE